MTFHFLRSPLACCAFFFLSAPLRAQEVALTFDDLPRTGEMPANTNRVQIVKNIVKILEDAHAPSVYGFVNGGKLASAPGEVEALKAWTAAGFPLANHGYSHLNLAETTIRRYTRDIAANEQTLNSLMTKDQQWHWFRYPYLEEGETLAKKRAVAAFLKQNRYRVAEVTLDFEDFLWNAPYARCLAQNDTASIDWLKSNYLIAAEERIAFGQKMSQTLYGRDIKHIMLLHVGAFETVMLPELLHMLKQKNFKLITLDEAANDPAYQTDAQWLTRHGGDFLTLTMRRRGLELPWHRRLPKSQLAGLCQPVIHSAELRQGRAARPSRRGRHRKKLQ